jgi:hypothetical protein
MLLGTGTYLYLVYAEYRVVLVDRVYNCSVSPYDDGYLLYLQGKL